MEVEKMSCRTLNVKIVGKGCDKYFELLKLVKDLLLNQKRKYTIKEINNEKDIIQLGVVQMPALIIDGRIVLQGTSFSEKMIVEALDVK
jgi:predicted DsbA family dithiol-disulfide isomerase